MRKESKALLLLRKNIVRLRDAKDWTDSDVARAAGLAPQEVYRYLNQPVNPGIDKLDKFAKAFGVEPWELLIEPGENPLPDMEKVDIKLDDLEAHIRQLKDTFRKTWRK